MPVSIRHYARERPPYGHTNQYFKKGKCQVELTTQWSGKSFKIKWLGGVGRGGMLAEMARLSSQQRPLYCYLLMSVWIFLLVAGM